MQRATRFVYLLLTLTFLICAAGLLVFWMAGPENSLPSYIGMIGYYGTFITLKLFFLHVLLTILSFFSQVAAKAANQQPTYAKATVGKASNQQPTVAIRTNLNKNCLRKPQINGF